MKFLITLACLSALGTLPLSAEAPSTPSPRAHAPQDAHKPAVKDDGCDTKGCPLQDQHGDTALSCTYTSGMATAWHCILGCTYKNSQWGALVDSSLCN